MSLRQIFRQSLVKRLIAGSAVLLTLALLALWWLVSQYMHQQMANEVVKRGETTAQSVQVAIQTADTKNSLIRLVNALAAGDGIKHLIVVKLVKGVAMVVAADDGSWVGGRADQQLPAEDWEHINRALNSPAEITHNDTRHHSTFDLARPVLMRSDDLRSNVKGVIYVAIDTTQIEAETMRHVWSVSGAMFCLIACLFGILYVFLRKNILRPLEDLRHAMQSREGHAGMEESPIHRPDEIGLLAHTYNDLIKTIHSYENQRQATMDTMVDGLITVDEEARITSFTHSAERIFGHSEREAIGQPFSLLMSDGFDPSHDGFAALYQRAQDLEDPSLAHQLQARRKNGDCFPIELSVGKAAAGAKSFYVGLVRDITERKKVEQLKSEFISTVSHELRTPLTSIRGSLGLLTTSNTFDSLPPKAHKLINLAHKNCERLVHLINDILDVEKIDSGKLNVHLSAHEVSGFLENALELNQGYADRHGVRFNLTATPPIQSHVLADPDRLMQVMANLLSNAAKFSPIGGEVQVRASLNKGMVRFEVQDFGEGMPEEFKSRIFQKFAQSDASSTRKHEGTGLGLNITKKLIEAMNGHIGFTTALGHGTTFFFELPLAPVLSEA